VLSPLMSISANDIDPVRQTLTSVARNIHLDNWEITHRDVDLKTQSQWSVRKYTLHGGKQEGVDVIVVNNGKLTFTVVPTRGMNLTLHGKIGNIPASEVEVVIDRQPSPRIRIRGRVDERMFYGPKLELWAEISTEPGADTFRIEDAVTNHSAYDQEFQIIYHA